MMVPIVMVYVSIFLIMSSAQKNECTFLKFWAVHFVFNIISLKIIICSVTKVV